jgi:hypothetical protein
MFLDEDILRMYEEQQEWEARALLEQIREYEATYQQDYDTLSSQQQREMEEHEMT